MSRILSKSRIKDTVWSSKIFLWSVENLLDHFTLMKATVPATAHVPISTGLTMTQILVELKYIPRIEELTKEIVKLTQGNNFMTEDVIRMRLIYFIAMPGNNVEVETYRMLDKVFKMLTINQRFELLPSPEFNIQNNLENIICLLPETEFKKVFKNIIKEDIPPKDFVKSKLRLMDVIRFIKPSLYEKQLLDVITLPSDELTEELTDSIAKKNLHTILYPLLKYLFVNFTPEMMLAMLRQTGIFNSKPDENLQEYVRNAFDELLPKEMD